MPELEPQNRPAKLEQREDLRRRIASNLSDIVHSRYGHHMDQNQSENIALEIERSAYEVALRQPEGQRAGTYAKAASRLLLNAVVKEESMDTAIGRLAPPEILMQDEQSWASQGLAGVENTGNDAASPPQSSYTSMAGIQEEAASLASAGTGPAGCPLESTPARTPRQPLRPIQTALDRGRAINRQMSLSLRKQEVKDVFSGITPMGKMSRAGAWGWLEPGSPALPHVLLQGDEVAVGRSIGETGDDEAATSPVPSVFSSVPAVTGGSAAPVGAPSTGRLNFVGVNDGRVSRLHCVFRPEPSAASTPACEAQTSAEPDSFRGVQHNPSQQIRLPHERSSLYGEHAVVPGALLIDCSTNGTFVNGARASSQGLGTPLRDGDRISLVLSVTPLVEQYFVFHAGEPADRDKREWASSTSVAFLPAEDRQLLSSPAASKLRMRSLQRMTTSKYTTADASTLEDFQCQICLGTLRSCVALEPCGHNFCAPCLSHHFASQLMTSNSLSCPLRCVAPSKVVANAAVRKLVHRFKVPRNVSAKQAKLSQSLAQSALMHSPDRLPGIDRSEEEDDEAEIQMSQLCPLNDDILPISAAGLKMKQVDALLSQVSKSESDSEHLISSLETLAKVAWNDDEVRKEVANQEGVSTIVNVMKRFSRSGGVQCNGCLAIVSLVRSESEICQSNQWRVARAGGLEVIVAAMRQFREYSMVQLCALLCMVPLALENTILQAHLATLSLPDIFAALAQHQDQADLQAKGLVALGVLGQGEEAMHDAIRDRQLRLGAARAIARALERHGRVNEEVLWAALFALAVLVREGSAPHSLALRSTAATGMLPLLQSCMAAYKAKAAARQEDGDEMIISAGDFLIRALIPAANRLHWERVALLTFAGAALGIAAWKCRGLVLGRS
ncbi:hypothetical protein COCOBI_08-3760 [Coccomyxa sp. Obi]|nr:hypothetical protein COCOBI_08-3760 [Coccomyxa sp. Obi]